MKKDPAVESIRKTRHEISKKCGHDTQALLERYRSQEAKYADRMVKEKPSTYDSTSRASSSPRRKRECQA